MDHSVEGPGGLPSSVAVMRLAVRTGSGQKLGHNILKLLTSVCYTVRTGDQVGWFEYGDEAFPCHAFRHG